jgi:peptidoglycan/LPS O-acetylase OafA/YrhL
MTGQQGQAKEGISQAKLAHGVPSIVEPGAQRPSVRHSQSTSQEAYARFIGTTQLPGLEGLRGLAILPVIWHHATPRLLPGILGKGAVGVDLFFALSGFLITTLLLRERRASGQIRLLAFYARRSLRIFPLYYVVLGFYALRALQTQASSDTARHFLHGLPYHATYTANWFLDYAVPYPVMFAFSWSLCVEEQFYWIWPGLVALFPQRGLLVGLMGAAVVVDALAEHAAFAAWLPAGSLGLRMLTSFAAPIGCGSVLAVLLDAPRGFRVASWLLGWRGSAPLLLLLSVGWLCVPATPYVSLSLTLAGLVGAVALRPDNGLAWLVEQAALRKLGTLSYALYLLHITALGLVRRFLPQYQGSAGVVFVLGLPLSVLFAEAAHRAVERPFLRLRRRFRNP